MGKAERKSRAIVLGMLFKADVTNANAGWTEENVTVLKKIETPDNQRHPYISGQALRRYLRDSLEDLLVAEPDDKIKFSPQKPGPAEKSPVVTEGDPEKYFDDDVLGFLTAAKGQTRRRESPLRVSAAFGLFPYQGDRDLGTRSLLGVTGNPEKGGDIFETEVTHNVFRTTWLLELDRVGTWRGFESTATKEKADLLREFTLDFSERKRRAKLLVRSLKYLHGGGRSSRWMMEFVPQFVAYARLTKKVALFLNTLELKRENGNWRLWPAPVTEVVKDYRADIEKLIVGLREGFGQITKDDVLKELSGAMGDATKVSVKSVGEAIDEMSTDLDGASF
jgi:CRISPR-associated protein Cst2